MKSGNLNSYFGVVVGEVEAGLAEAGVAPGVVAGRRGAVTEPAGEGAEVLGGGAGTPETMLYASITGLVMSVDGAAQSTGLDCDETSMTTE